MKISTLSCPSLTERQVESLKRIGVTKLLDIVFEDKSEIIAAASLTLSSYEQLKKDVQDLIEPVPIYASQLPESTHFSTGVELLDGFLNGGLLKEETLELFGDIGTGKTQFCMKIASEFVKKNHNVLYFDFKCDFLATRFLQFCNRREDLEKIEIMPPSSITEVLQDLEDLQARIVNRIDKFYNEVKLLIFDSVPMIIYTAVDGEDEKTWRYQQEKFSEKVVELSKLNGGIVTIFVNHATTKRYDKKKPNFFGVSQSTSKSKMAMGSSYWGHRTNFRIQLTKLESSQVHTATLVKSSRTGCCGQTFNFIIEETDINCYS